ncbi:acyl-CoA thioesterase II [Exophiala spinifera]|uniref:Acyl-CoA thioesterase II n=1 Tax=Exophiala spinifera TaxID=91928 RepID=A0A0D2BEK3_9EURO|nr:acyl-CoA thioesterase II [Exophiala spinifera]KIW09819.1 acyl-CoA thioesterase II [Exophiala spinifera]
MASEKGASDLHGPEHLPWPFRFQRQTESVPTDLGPENGFMPKGSPIESRGHTITNEAEPWRRHAQQWIRTRGTISASGGHQAQAVALAYLSDSYLLGTISRVNHLYRFRGVEATKSASSKPSSADEDSEGESVERLKEIEGFRDDPDNRNGRPEVDMTVSLSHSIYFHRPKDVRADQWLYFDMSSPWSGDERGLAVLRIVSREGVQLGTCIQEGLVRLTQSVSKI